MAGLNLRTGLSADVSAGATSGMQATPQTVTQAAYGFSGPAPGNAVTSGMPTVASAVVCLSLLVFIWWSLPA